ncbi:MAG TPA: hypothetical protein VNQ56_05415 [Pseudolabrys sp.]|nr:hypothetical protein [Pseudolabrys sp.]
MLDFPPSFPIPSPLVLPAASLLLLIVAALVAFYAWWIGCPRSGGEGVTPWDVAAALTFLGCAAAILGEIEHVVEYFWLNDTRTSP